MKTSFILTMGFLSVKKSENESFISWRTNAMANGKEFFLSSVVTCVPLTVKLAQASQSTSRIIRITQYRKPIYKCL